MVEAKLVLLFCVPNSSISRNLDIVDKRLIGLYDVTWLGFRPCYINISRLSLRFLTV